MKSKTAIIIAIFSALLGVLLVMSYITTIEEEAALDSNIKNVVVAKKYIARYILITSSLCKIAQIPVKYMQPNSVSSIKELLDKDGKSKFVSLVPIMENESILTTKLTTPGKETGLAVVISRGKRAISIPVAEDTSVSGLIKPGNRVDLISTFEDKSVYLLQNLLVLSVGNEILGAMEEKEKRESIISDISGSMGEESITLAVTPKEALKIAYARNKCTFNIVLRSPVDNTIEDVSPVNQKNLLGVPVKPKAGIKVYRGVESTE